MSIDWNNPKEVAEKHYKFLVEDNIEMWKETLMDDIKQQMEGLMRGTTGEMLEERLWMRGKSDIAFRGKKPDMLTLV